jgi:hypothetical protein
MKCAGEAGRRWSPPFPPFAADPPNALCSPSEEPRRHDSDDCDPSYTLCSPLEVPVGEGNRGCDWAVHDSDDCDDLAAGVQLNEAGLGPSVLRLWFGSKSQPNEMDQYPMRGGVVRMDNPMRGGGVFQGYVSGGVSGFSCRGGSRDVCRSAGFVAACPCGRSGFRVRVLCGAPGGT